MHDSLAAIHYKNSTPVEVAVLTLDFHQEGSRWLAECLELGTATYADTLEDVRLEVAEAIALQLEEVEAHGFLDEFLHDRCVKLYPIISKKPQPSRHFAWAMPALARA